MVHAHNKVVQQRSRGNVYLSVGQALTARQICHAHAHSLSDNNWAYKASRTGNQCALVRMPSRNMEAQLEMSTTIGPDLIWSKRAQASGDKIDAMKMQEGCLMVTKVV